MVDYQRLYTMLFNGITDALGQLDEQNYGNVKMILKNVQIDAEQLYLLQEEDEA